MGGETVLAPVGMGQDPSGIVKLNGTALLIARLLQREISWRELLRAVQTQSGGSAAELEAAIFITLRKLREIGALIE